MNPSLLRLANLIAHASAGLSAQQLRWHPEGKWSIAEILEHLSLTYSGTRVVFERCLQAGKPSASRATPKDRLRAFVVMRLGYLPGGRQAPAGVSPKGTAPEKVIFDMARNIAGMDESIRACEQHFGCDVKLVNHPFLGPLTADEWRRFHWLHGRHHLRQIRRVRRLMESQ